MDQHQEEHVDRVQQALAAVEHATSPDDHATAVAALVSTLEEAGAIELAARVSELSATVTGSALASATEALWHEWSAEDEAQKDAAMLAVDPDLAGMFVSEAFDHLGTIEATLLRLEENPADRGLIDDVFRPFHTIKGNAGALGVSSVQSLAHRVENLLDLCRSGERVIGSREIDVVLKAVDLLTAMLTDLGARATGKGGRVFRADRLALIGHVDALIESQAPPAAAPTVPAANAPATEVVAPDPVRVEAVAQEPAPAPAPQVEEFRQRRSDDRDQLSVKVDTRKLDGLVDIVGELVILQSLIHEDAALARTGDERLTRNLAQLRRITSELQRGATAMRMVPIRQTFQKMARLVRDVSKRAGKTVGGIL